MDIGKPLIDYGAVDAGKLRDAMLALPADFWTIDQDSRAKSAGDRPGNAVYYYHPMPPGVRRLILAEAQTGTVSALRYAERPLFGEIQRLIETCVQPLFPDCDPIWAQLAELPPGGVIAPHADSRILAMVHRLHIPLVTHPDVAFVIGGDSFHLKPDRLYDLNNVMEHAVYNRSDLMRVHLLIDMMPHSLARAHYYDDADEMIAAVARFELSPEQLARYGVRADMPRTPAAS